MRLPASETQQASLTVLRALASHLPGADPVAMAEAGYAMLVHRPREFGAAVARLEQAHSPLARDRVTSRPARVASAADGEQRPPARIKGWSHSRSKPMLRAARMRPVAAATGQPGSNP